MDQKHLLINFFGAPSAGKTTAAAELFTLLKKRGMECNLVPDLPKSLVLEGYPDALHEPLYVFANQLHCISSSYNHMPVTLTDSPVLLALVYHDNISENLKNVIIEEHNRFDSLNIFLPLQSSTYSMAGRVHSVTQAISIDQQVLHLLQFLGVPCFNWADIDNPAEFVCEEVIRYFAETKHETALSDVVG